VARGFNLKLHYPCPCEVSPLLTLVYDIQHNCPLSGCYRKLGMFNLYTVDTTPPYISFHCSRYVGWGCYWTDLEYQLAVSVVRSGPTVGYGLEAPCIYRLYGQRLTLREPRPCSAMTQKKWGMWFLESLDCHRTNCPYEMLMLSFVKEYFNFVHKFYPIYGGVRISGVTKYSCLQSVHEENVCENEVSVFQRFRIARFYCIT